MHSFAAAAAFTEKQRRGEAEYGHKAYLYTTCIYVETWIFNISVQLIRHLVVQRSAERASVCVCPSEVLNNCGVPDWVGARVHLRGQLHRHQLSV